MSAEGQLDALTKEVYVDQVEDAIDNNFKCQELFPFKENKKVGSTYVQPVKLADEQGFTYLGTDEDIEALNDAVGLITQQAKIKPHQLDLRVQISQRQAHRAIKEGPAAFVSATEFKVMGGQSSARKRIELGVLYGQVGLNTIASRTNVDTTTTTLVVTASEWAPGMYSGLLGAKVNFWLDSTKVGTSGADAIFTIARVTNSTKTLRITGTTTGISDLDTKVNSNPDEVKMFFQDEKEKGMYGLSAIAQNTGTLFDISATDYDLWRANNLEFSGQLTAGKLLDAVSESASRGGAVDNPEFVALVPSAAWNKLNNSESALRRRTSDSSKAKNGFNAIEYESDAGTLSVMSHNCVKAGEVLIFDKNQIARIGSTDVKFDDPDLNDGRYWFFLPGYSAYEMVIYSDQAIICKRPTSLIRAYGFENTLGS